MKIIDLKDIGRLNIPYSECVSWVEDAFRRKSEVKLPAKISLKLDGNVFFNTMPCYIPYLNSIGVKLVSRYPDRIPALVSDLLLFDAKTGDALALMNGDWITAIRTGAVAALSIKKLQSKAGGVYSFVGLGNTARATLLCLLEIQPDVNHHIRLLSYKGQEESFIERFSSYKNVAFEVVNSNSELIQGADVIVSCVTAFNDTFAEDGLYGEGVLLVPVHTRGFQNCDLFFDKIYGDDREHVKDFKYFNQFKHFAELSDVLNGNDPGRSNSKERIIAYNIGIALHDVYFAAKIYQLLENNSVEQITMDHPSDKFWV